MFSRVWRFFKRLNQIRPKNFLLMKGQKCSSCPIEKYAILEQTGLAFHIAETLDTQYQGQPSHEEWVMKADKRIVDVVLDDDDTTWLSGISHFLEEKPFLLMSYHECDHCSVRRYKILDVTQKAYLLKGTFDFDCKVESHPFHQLWILKKDSRIIDVYPKDQLPEKQHPVT